MQSKSKTVDKHAEPVIAPHSAPKPVERREEEDVRVLLKRALQQIVGLDADNRRLKGLLEQSLAQLANSNDEYHSELVDKIRAELESAA